MRVGGALSLKNEAETMTSDNQLITVGSRGYIRVASDTGSSSNRTALLSDGTASGQILYLECNCAAAAWELPDAGNINLPATRTFNSGNVIQLLWNGTTWLEVHFSDN
jgi:hypothetical protein